MPARKKEIRYFDQDILYRSGEAWYHSHFPLPHRLGRRRVTFEATPEYLYYPGAAERILSYDPRLKLVVVLRDPVERAFPAWNMCRTLRHEHPDLLRGILPECDPMLRVSLSQMLARDSFPEFDEAVWEEVDAIRAGTAALEPGYVRRGIYQEQLQRYLKCFARVTDPDTRQRAAQEGSGRCAGGGRPVPGSRRPTGGRRRILKGFTPAGTSTRWPVRLAGSCVSSINHTRRALCAARTRFRLVAAAA